MSDEDFRDLKEALALAHARVEHSDLRATVLLAPQRPAPRAATNTRNLEASMIATREQVLQQISTLTEAGLRQVANYIAFLKFQERLDQSSPGGEMHTAEGHDLTDEEKSPDALRLTANNPAGAATHELSLEQMLAQITEDNRHGEVDFGPPVGKEVW